MCLFYCLSYIQTAGFLKKNECLAQDIHVQVLQKTNKQTNKQANKNKPKKGHNNKQLTFDGSFNDGRGVDCSGCIGHWFELVRIRFGKTQSETNFLTKIALCYIYTTDDQ